METFVLVGPEELEAQMKRCLQQRRMPDHFLYIGDVGAGNWLDLDSSEDFPVASRLQDLLAESLPFLEPHLAGGLNVVSLGVGSGKKERLLLEMMMRHGSPRYYAVDISAPMVRRALETVADMDIAKTEVVAFVEDLPRLRRLWQPPVVLCMLGNNFCNYDPDYLLSTVREQLTPDDLFLFDCHLLPETADGGVSVREQTERYYRSERNVRFNMGPLVQRGMPPECCDFHLNLVPVETAFGTVYRTSKWLEVLRDADVSFPSGTVSFSTGDRIQLGFTYKYKFAQVRGILTRHLFEVVESCLSANQENCLVLARKR